MRSLMTWLACGWMLWMASAAPARDPETEPDDPAFRDFGETVVVTAARRPERVEDTAAPVTVLGREDLDRSPALVLDETLRQVPGFSLFRRDSSLSAHPTAQGVSLRGIGPSGTSRSLVLFDGLPLTDPVGGWVAWNRIPPSALSAVEVVPGAASALYGSTSLGGTIQLLPRSPTETTVEARLSAGERGLADGEVFAGGKARDWRWSASTRSFTTDGFFALAPRDRGPVDRPVTVDFTSALGRVHRDGGWLGLQHYEEDRGNGTRLQTNDTRITTLEGGWAGTRWQARGHHQDQRFGSRFSRILPGRTGEVLTARQDIPATSSGAAVTWTSPGGWLAGADGRRVTWEQETRDLDQTLAGAFVQKSFEAGDDLSWIGALRVDRWDNATEQTTISPRLGLVWQAAEPVTVRASAYRGFRAPTLNELFRPFRVGNVITRANDELSEERLTGVESGFDWASRRGAVIVSADVFWNELADPIGNATVEIQEDLILRQRQNLGEATVVGFEGRLRASLTDRWRLQAAWLSTDAEVDTTSLDLPQVPPHQGSFGVTRSSRTDRLGLTLVGRWGDRAFEDDLNQLPLPSYVVVDLSLRLDLGRGFQLTTTANNLLDEDVVTGRLPLEELAAPRQVWVGVGWRGPGDRPDGRQRNMTQ